MRTAVVTCAYGGPKFAEMTARWWRSLKQCDGDFMTVIVGQGLAPLPDDVKPDVLVYLPENQGFAYGMNQAIYEAARHEPRTERFVVVNNDCTFPRKNWLTKLHERVRSYGAVMVPLNTKCNTAACESEGPLPGFPLEFLTFAPAVCWSVSNVLVATMRHQLGYILFDPDFSFGWAEDNHAAAVIRKLTGWDRPFIVEPESWIKHDGSVTVNQVVRERNSIQWTKENERLLSKKLKILASLKLDCLNPSFDPCTLTAWPGPPPSKRGK